MNQREYHAAVMYLQYTSYFSYDDIGNLAFIPFGLKLWVIKEYFMPQIHEFYWEDMQ